MLGFSLPLGEDFIVCTEDISLYWVQETGFVVPSRGTPLFSVAEAHPQLMGWLRGGRKRLHVPIQLPTEDPGNNLQLFPQFPHHKGVKKNLAAQFIGCKTSKGWALFFLFLFTPQTLIVHQVGQSRQTVFFLRKPDLRFVDAPPVWSQSHKNRVVLLPWE